MRKYIANFHYLTQDLKDRTHTEQVQLACSAGANWIQYRCHSKTDSEMISELEKIGAICDDWGTTLIITDHYQLLPEVDAQGVHIENMDADLGSIRDQIGEDKTLGASANSFAQIRRLAEDGYADYAGFGPFALTDTKPNNYPLIGVEGYRTLITQCADTAVDLPILAVGGVKLDDVSALLATGIYGIAVSAAINKAQDPADMVKQFYRAVKAHV